MAGGLVIMDVLWALGLASLTMLSVTVALALAALCTSPLWALTLALPGAVLTWIAACALALALLPKPKPGRYRLMRDRASYYWAFALIVRRWLDVPPMSLVVRQSALVRFVVLRAAGARVAFTAQMSSDATVLDPNLLVMGPGAMLGSQSTVAGHFIVGTLLVLAPVVLEAGAQVALGVVIAPGVRVGAKARLEGRATIGPDCTIGPGAVVEGCAVLARGVVLGARARIPLGSVVPAQTSVADGGTWTPVAAAPAAHPPSPAEEPTP